VTFHSKKTGVGATYICGWGAMTTNGKYASLDISFNAKTNKISPMIRKKFSSFY
jgi:hypothetical protein